MAAPTLHRTDSPAGALGPWEPAQRYWRRNEPEVDLVARSVDGKRLLVGEVKWTVEGRRRDSTERPVSAHLPGAGDAEIVYARFVPDPALRRSRAPEVHEVGAADMLAALR